jgi:CRP/FNR family transcriptional regulator
MKALEIPKEIIEQDPSQVKLVQLISGHVAPYNDSHCTNLLVVEKGNLRVFMRSADGRTFTLYRVYSGECCCLSIVCIMNGNKFPAFTEVEGEGTAYIISADYVRKCMNENTMWQSYLFKQLTSKITQFTDLTDNLVFNSMDSRVAKLLSKGFEKYDVVHTTHQSLANEVGTSREVVSRSLGHLESKGLIKLARGQVEIIDHKGLQSFLLVH